MKSMNSIKFSKDILKIQDIDNEIIKISKKIQEDITVRLRRKGAIVGISGGIDSSVTMALAAKALGPERVLGIMLPEKESNSDSLRLARDLADQFGVPSLVENISGALDGYRCYERRDEAIKRVFPEFDPLTYKSKIGIHHSGIKQSLPPVFYLTIICPDGTEKKKVLPVREYLLIVAASNFKQRSRMSMLYFHAESCHYAVVGTANKHEVEQGFFVKHGDGGVDLMPIGNYYKSQVYQIAEVLGIPEEIIQRTPTTDTYSAEQSQEEFFFQLPFIDLDLLWYAFENEFNIEEVAEVMGKTSQEVELIFNNFKRKQKTTEYLRLGAL
ncbi:MAG: NAD(+) synthase [Bacteroidales bacterium]|nr:NAD(+) synthase [Bacteroidales bacterium]